MSNKLDKPFENRLKDFNFPKIYKKNDGEAFSETELHFLFYRMSRLKDISLDAEILLIIQNIDRIRSNDFSEMLLKIFFESGAEAKHKWCLTLASILGNDTTLETLKSKANYWADNARPKMAEYAVQAIVLNGSLKALRTVDFFARKYKTKNIGKTAALAFKSAAEFLGVSENDLSNSIIDDFGFKGLFKNFTVLGENYRAFINNDFTLTYLNEDNTALKVLPKSTSEKVKIEFKNIAKGIKETVKAQTPRLENYLITQYRWENEKWQNLFLNNPVMFVYGIRLIWGVFEKSELDEKFSVLKYTFTVQEDQITISDTGSEINFSTSEKIGLVHPIQLKSEVSNYWKNYFSDASLTPVFPQIERKVFFCTENKKTEKISTDYSGIQINAFTFIGNLEKRGWLRGSIIYGGSISSYYKFFSEEKICVIIEQTGSLRIGSYEEPATLGGLIFVKSNSAQFGNYFYDEMLNENDPHLIAFGEVPPIIFSEVIADIEKLLEQKIKN